LWLITDDFDKANRKARKGLKTLYLDSSGVEENTPKTVPPSSVLSAVGTIVDTTDTNPEVTPDTNPVVTPNINREVPTTTGIYECVINNHRVMQEGSNYSILL
jgi:hypothetical protein